VLERAEDLVVDLGDDAEAAVGPRPSGSLLFVTIPTQTP
jgi:hypothetical protein